MSGYFEIVGDGGKRGEGFVDDGADGCFGEVGVCTTSSDDSTNDLWHHIHFFRD